MLASRRRKLGSLGVGAGMLDKDEPVSG